MSEQPAPTPEPTPTPAPTPAPAPTPTPEPTPTPAAAPATKADDGILAAVNALPEKITNALRESMTPPAASTPPAAPAASENGPQEPTGGVPGKRSFAEWWFGK